MHFATLVIGEHDYKELSKTLAGQGRIDYCYITKGNFIRFRPGLQQYESMRWRNKFRKEALRIAFEDEASEKFYSEVLQVFGDEDTEFVGNINWQLMSELSFEKDIVIILDMLNKYGHLPYFYKEYADSDMSLEEYVRLDNLWAPYAICDLQGVSIPNLNWWERSSKTNTLKQREEQYRFILDIPSDIIVTLYHCHR